MYWLIVKLHKGCKVTPTSSFTYFWHRKTLIIYCKCWCRTCCICFQCFRVYSSFSKSFYYPTSNSFWCDRRIWCNITKEERIAVLSLKFGVFSKYNLTILTTDITFSDGYAKNSSGFWLKLGFEAFGNFDMWKITWLSSICIEVVWLLPF